MNRRDFLASSVPAASAFLIVPRHVVGGPGHTAPSDRLRIAAVGAGGMGAAYLRNLDSETIVALCDVDDERAAETYALYPDARRYRDFREMLDREDAAIDAVVVATPDHTHAVVAVAAARRGKHLYCAKPLARTIYETRAITEAAREAGVATQMSVQNNASDDHRVLAEWIRDGAIGAVREVQIWSNRPIWPQGVERPSETPPVPDTLDWDLWLGPAPRRPYHPAYVPFAWRGWWDFGTGALGDMGCHHFDPVFRALELGYPTSVHASSSKLFDESAPAGSIVHYDFPARGDHPPVRVTWYDGGLQPPRPAELDDGLPMGVDYGGTLFFGDEGVILCDGIGLNPRLLPESKMRAYEPPPATIPRSVGHYQEWIAAAKGGPPAGAPFAYGGPLTEVVLLGNVAVRRPGRELHFDAETLSITNDDEANAYLREPYHNGWSLE